MFQFPLETSSWESTVAQPENLLTDQVGILNHRQLDFDILRYYKR
jgi:hypothetical protein